MVMEFCLQGIHYTINCLHTGGKQQRFHECHLMPFEIVLGDKAVFQHVEGMVVLLLFLVFYLCLFVFVY